jgi:hypothetical protein
VTEAARKSSIVTFYSYKGGTGRTMALANAGWILASNGKRVLLIDWDFEAPGLHRYLHPFIEDKELASTPGLIDFFTDFAVAARVANMDASNSDAKWFEPYASLVRYTVPVDWEFPNGGALELVAAGRQDAGYSVNVTTYDWQGFYSKGGGVFLEALKARLRNDYDYVLIDSRTGISDTSGICTVQMPDQLVVLFTLNQQSMKGAAAVADAADRMRRKSSGEPGLEIWPVPTRVVVGETERLEAAHDLCRVMFERHIGHLDRERRSAYWGNVEIMQTPLYAFEETLATFADRRGQSSSMLARMEALASLLDHRDESSPLRMPKMDESERIDVLERFRRSQRAAPTAQRFAFVDYGRKEASAVESIVAKLAELDMPTWLDVRDAQPGSNWGQALESARERSAVVLFFVGASGVSEQRLERLRATLSKGGRVLPVMLEGADPAKRPPEELRHLQFTTIRLRGRKTFPEDIRELARNVGYYLRDEIPRDPEDPQKGRFGGSASINRRMLSATVKPIGDDYYEIVLTVQGPDLTGNVEFHLHPTFSPSLRTVAVEDGKATLELLGWGAFTAGAIADNGKTRLELDLAQDSSFPEAFRSR